MRIVDQKSIQNASGIRASRPGTSAGGARFSLDQGATAPKAEALAPASILGGLDALIAIRSEDTTRERRRRSMRRGHGLLDLLDEIKLALLSGRLPVELQNRLAVALREESFSGDPRLDAVLESIDLRAAVELAKLRQASQSG
jgi:hypothetical protein